jgi:GGDEF domain-containing protein
VTREDRPHGAYDALTNLPNRVLFRDGSSSRQSDPARPEQLAVMYIDIDNSKRQRRRSTSIDELLKNLRTGYGPVSGSETAARLGGDEFAVIQPRSGASRKLPSVHDIYQAIREPMDSWVSDLHRCQHRFALAPGDGWIDQLLKNADLLYGAKGRWR